MNGAIPITDERVLLLRQVHPLHLKPDGTVASAAFVPGPTHQGLLSTRHERIGARAAYEQHLNLGIDSEGTWAISVEEVHHNGVCDGVRAFEDGHLDGNPEAHVSVDFNATPSRNAATRVAKHLARCATARERLHP